MQLESLWRREVSQHVNFLEQRFAMVDNPHANYRKLAEVRGGSAEGASEVLFKEAGAGNMLILAANVLAVKVSLPLHPLCSAKRCRLHSI